MSLAFVGRRDELARLLSLGAPGRPVAGVVLGAPGTGKTRLLAEAIAGAHDGDALKVAGFAAESSVPLAAAQPLLAALRAVPDHGARLTDLLSTDPPQFSEASLQPLRVFEATHRCLAATSGRRIVVDDLQWVDPASRALVHYLVRAAHTDGTRLVVLVASRPVPVALDLLESFRRMLGDAGVELCELGALDREAGVSLVRELNPARSADEAAALWEATAGSPFWLSAAAASDATDRIEHLLARWMSAAGRDASAVADLLGIAGRPLTVDDVATFLGWTPQRTEEAVATMLATPLGAGDGADVDLAHDLVRDVVVQRLAPQRRKELHATLARHLTNRAGDDLAGLLAALHHARSAGDVPLTLALRVATSPGRRLIGSEALHDLLALADSGDRSDSRVLELETALATLASELGDEPTALDRWTSLAAGHADARRRAWAALAAARAAFRLRQPDTSRSFIARARSLDLDDAVLTANLDAVESGVALWSDHRRDEADRLAARAADALRSGSAIDGDDEGVRGDALLAALNAQYDVATVAGDDAAMLRIAEEMVLTSAARPLARLDAEREIGFTLAMSGRIREAEGLLRRLCDVAEEQVLPAFWVDAAYSLASVCFELGKLGEAAELVENVGGLAERTGKYPMRRANLERLQHRLDVHRGSWQSAVRSLRIQAAAETDPHLRLGVLEECALWFSRVEGPRAAAEVRGLVEEGAGCASQSGCQRCGSRFSVMAAEALARVGAVTEAEGRMAGWSPPAGAAAPPRFWQRRVDALIAAARAAAQAGEGLAAIVEEAESHGWMIDGLWGRMDWAAAVRDRDGSRAVSLYTAAAATAVSLGAPTVERLAGQALRSLGVRNWRRGPTDPRGTLTPREDEIARMVGAGLTNREIAESLFLAPKTVERHISNALAKLGARNRTELVSLLGPAPPHAEGTGPAR
jgi:DNA-binding CsgD family transcriptional regulator/tetratricopeptide (TPR) repeat protein